MSVALLYGGGLLIAIAAVLFWIWRTFILPEWLDKLLVIAYLSLPFIGLFLVITGTLLKTGIIAADFIVWEQASPAEEVTVENLTETPASEVIAPTLNPACLPDSFWLDSQSQAYDNETGNRRPECDGITMEAPAEEIAGVTTEGVRDRWLEQAVETPEPGATEEPVAEPAEAAGITTESVRDRWLEQAAEEVASDLESIGAEEPSITSLSWWGRNGGILTLIAAIALVIVGILLTKRGQTPGNAGNRRTTSRPHPRSGLNV